MQIQPSPRPPTAAASPACAGGTPVLPDELAPPNPGTLTAIVVGPKGEEIYTDELGRLKVRVLFTRPSEHAVMAGAATLFAHARSQAFGFNGGHFGVQIEIHHFTLACHILVMPPDPSSVLC